MSWLIDFLTTPDDACYGGDESRPIVKHLVRRQCDWEIQSDRRASPVSRNDQDLPSEVAIEHSTHDTYYLTYLHMTELYAHTTIALRDQSSVKDVFASDLLSQTGLFLERLYHAVRLFQDDVLSWMAHGDNNNVMPVPINILDGNPVPRYSEETLRLLRLQYSEAPALHDISLGIALECFHSHYVRFVLCDIGNPHHAFNHLTSSGLFASAILYNYYRYRAMSGQFTEGVLHD